MVLNRIDRLLLQGISACTQDSMRKDNNLIKSKFQLIISPTILD